MDTIIMTDNKINALAKEVLDIEANSILRLKIILEKNLIKQWKFYITAKAELLSPEWENQGL